MVVVIDYEFGGAVHVAEALKKLNIDFICSKNEAEISKADKIILPGLEQAGKAVRKLHLLNLFTSMRIFKKPVLGIGLGMQLMSEFSKEGDVACLGIFPGTVDKFLDSNEKLASFTSIQVKITSPNKLFDNIPSGSGFYFCNKYYLNPSEFTIATAMHGVEFSAAIHKDNFYGVQFHPENSGEVGLQLLKNFCSLI